MNHMNRMYITPETLKKSGERQLSISNRKLIITNRQGKLTKKSINQYIASLKAFENKKKVGKIIS